MMENLSVSAQLVSEKMKHAVGMESKFDDINGYETMYQMSWQLDKDNEHGQLACTVLPKLDFDHHMKALTWKGKKHVEVINRARPMLTDPDDVIIRVTSTTVCGSDLHMYHNAIPGVSVMRDGDILGHEFMGIITEVGTNVKKFQVGDRVVSAFDINCGTCEQCTAGKPTLCDRTNPSIQMEKIYGHRIAGAFGYTHMTGAYPGGQAEYVRRPFADTGLLKVPNNLPDEKVLLLTDTLCTGYHGCVCANVKQGSTVCVWGAGPVGLAAAYLAIKVHGASRVIVIDHNEYRLQKASSFGCEVVNFDKCDVVDTIFKAIPKGPDCCIECAGFRFPKSLYHQVITSIMAETDSPESLQEIIKVCKKGGSIGLIGDYFGWSNKFPIGAMMEKGLSVRGSQAPVQKYWPILLPMIESGEIDPAVLITHKMDFEDIAQVYMMMDEKLDNVIKVQCVTAFGRQLASNSVAASAPSTIDTTATTGKTGASTV